MNGASMSRPSPHAAHLTDEQIRATVLGEADAPCWSEAEQALIAAVDALHQRATLSDAEFAALSAHYDEAQDSRDHPAVRLLSHRVVSGERAGAAAGGEGGDGFRTDLVRKLPWDRMGARP